MDLETPDHGPRASDIGGMGLDWRIHWRVVLFGKQSRLRLKTVKFEMRALLTFLTLMILSTSAIAEERYNASSH